MTKNTDKAEVLSAFFAFFCWSLLRWPAFRNPRHLSLAGKSGTRQIHHQWGRTRLGSISTNWTDINPWWDGLTSAEGAVWCHCNATFNYLILIMVTRRGSWRLEETKCHSCLQVSRHKELQASQPHLDAWKANIGTHFQTHKGHSDEKWAWS